MEASWTQVSHQKMKKVVKVLKIHLWHSALYLLALATLMHVSHAADDLCDGQGSVLKKAEVAVACPVREDIHKSKHSVIISHFDGTNSRPVEVFACDWLSRLNSFDCITKFDFELVALGKDHVVAKVSRDKLLTTGSYRCQLAPAKIDEVHANCSICFPEEPVFADELMSKSPGDVEKLQECPACQGEAGCQGRLEDVHHLCIVITLLLALNALLLILFHLKRWLWRRYWERDRGRGRQEEMNEKHHQNVDWPWGRMICCQKQKTAGSGGSWLQKHRLCPRCPQDYERDEDNGRAADSEQGLTTIQHEDSAKA